MNHIPTQFGPKKKLSKSNKVLIPNTQAFVPSSICLKLYFSAQDFGRSFIEQSSYSWQEQCKPLLEALG
jgi:hypothetical protein